MSRTFQLLLLLALGGIVRAADVSSNNVTDGPHSCGGVVVPYPFGIDDGNSREGFEVICEAGKPVLPTGGDATSIPIVNFSIETAEARVLLPVGWQCYDSTGARNGSSDYLALEIHNKSMYRISNTRNDLFVLGCQTLGYLGSHPKLYNNSTYYTQFTGCLCYCDNSESAVSGACSGVGCCRVDIPPNLDGNAVGFDDSSYYNHSDVVDFNPCNYAFVAEKGSYTFSTTDLNMNLDRTPRLMPVTLDWAIRENNLTCEQASRKDGYACISSNSRCLNSTNGPGYICNCTDGYEGNPYIADGCTDINECERLGSHYHCKGHCKNQEGYYECTCPKRTHSADPYKEECQPDFPPNAKIIVVLFTGGKRVISPGSWWPFVANWHPGLPIRD